MKLNLKSALIGTVIFIFAITGKAQSQYENVMIGEGPAANGPCEPSVAISKKDSNYVVAGAVLNYAYRSSDGGRTWEAHTLESKYGVYGDPVLVSNAKGHFYYLHLADPSKEGWGSEGFLDRIVIQRSKNNGKKYDKGKYFGLNTPKVQDKHWIAIDPNSGKMVVTWTQFDEYGSDDPQHFSNIMVSTSDDNGRTWTEAKRINQVSGGCLDDDHTTEGAVPTFGPNGEIYVSWSVDDKIYFDMSLDGGYHWLEEDRMVANQPGGWVIEIEGLNRCNGMPVTTCDLSKGEHNGRIYVNWIDNRNGHYDNFVAYSDDQGVTWSAPQRVTNDVTKRDQFLTWMTVDQSTGYLYCVYYDRRNYNSAETDVFWSYSKDGGKTWVDERISANSFTPITDIFFGDYNNIDAVNGMIRPIWTAYKDGRKQIFTAILNQPE